ncbi:MAG TPA: hypothetical protein VG944_22290, partial [Fimbriimonas sp.]|nr:hypothetical protein [Fimbriimonas sp.]
MYPSQGTKAKKIITKEAPPPAETDLDRLIELQQEETAVNKAVSESNVKASSYESIEAAAKSIKTLKSPTTDAIDSISAEAADLANVQSDAFTKWANGTHQDAKGIPQGGVQKDLAALKAPLRQAVANYKAALKGRVLPATASTDYLACLNGLIAAIHRIDPYAQVAVATQARADAKTIVTTVNSLSGAADKTLTSPDNSLKGPQTATEYKNRLDKVTPVLSYAAKSGDIEKAVTSDLLTSLGMKIGTSAASLAKDATAWLTDLSTGSVVDERSFAQEARNAEDVLKQYQDDPKGFLITAHTELIKFTADASAEAAAQAGLANLAQSLGTSSLSSLDKDGKLAKALAGCASTMNQDQARLGVVNGLLNGTYQPNLSTWDAERVPLFNLEDVQQLLAALTPSIEAHRVADPTQSTFQTSQTDLIKAKEALIDSRQAVDDARRVLANAKNALEVAQHDASTGSTATADAAAAKKTNDAQAAVDADQLAVDQAQSVADQASNQLSDDTASNAPASTLASDRTAVTTAKKVVSDRKAQLAFDQSKLTEAKTAQSQADTALQTAQQAVKDAQAASDKATTDDTTQEQAVRT